MPLFLLKKGSKRPSVEDTVHFLVLGFLNLDVQIKLCLEKDKTPGAESWHTAEQESEAVGEGDLPSGVPAAAPSAVGTQSMHSDKMSRMQFKLCEVSPIYLYPGKY